MISGTDQWVFVISAYAIGGLVIGLLIGWIVWDRRRQQARLDALEQRGIRRRSAM